MTIPPFPSQDLAKLVLGYLAEEQLMTAYDEFLQASPYLDALQNEYDRIFMTSLKSILAEYRAVKIYVETCKPNLLRKKIFQCTNLLDIVKLLVNNIDLNKIQAQESAYKPGLDKHQHSANSDKSNTCETCISLKHVSCLCNSKLRTQPFGNQSSHTGDSQASIETTLLADLPGNHVTTRKKQIKVLDKNTVFLSDDLSETESQSRNISIDENNSSHSVQLKSEGSTVTLNSTVKETDLAESRQKIEEFNNVLKLVVDKNNTVTGSENIPNQRVSNASTFQDFASGVSGKESQNPNVPDSSTSESLNTQMPLNKDFYKDNVIEPSKRPLLLQLSHRNDKIELQTCRDSDKILKYPKIRVKPDDQKVKILSDVKVTNKKKTMKNATSTPITTTPLIQMKTIVINGTPAYKQTPVITNHTYTKDEIMAMPTLIVVPASGSSKISTNAQPLMTLSCNPITNASSTSRPLSPLVIDVPPTPAVIKQPEGITQLPDLKLPNLSEVDLVKTVDFTKNASVPKDNITSGALKTPQVLPPVRKSSSTPRRTTHVRVLDFTTPRRILHETINEQAATKANVAPVEIVLGSSPNVPFVDNTVAGNSVNSNTAAVYSNTIVQKVDGCETVTMSAKENTTVNKPKPSEKSNWDADLRAILANDSSVRSSIIHRKKNTKKKKTIEKTDTTQINKLGSNIISPKMKKASKKRRKVIAEEEDDAPPVTAIKPEVPVKPTINIISGSDRVIVDTQIIQDINKDEIVQNKSNDNEDICADTPEGDRLSLQNVIGAKLNISDLLETPYKQALYDIQMGTPRFLPDLPGEPLSDIKITNIPTPRFLDTPKPVQATPSSWSSRPTDYSSGGSYYKPDDQDYMPITDLRCVVSSSSKEDINLDKSVELIKEDEKKSRPQRKCAKNVSYYRLAGATYKTKEAYDTIEATSTCSDSTGSNEYKKKEPIVKTPRDRSKSNKSVTKKRVSTKKSKSPATKEKTKAMLKMKPRQTPTKLTPARNRKKNETPGYMSPNKHKRIRTTSKDKIENSTAPLIVAAPTKSRRKSSTPRKLHCTKSFNTENSDHTSPETIENTKQNASRVTVPSTQDSDTEQIALRWSDDGSQDIIKIKDTTTLSQNECEDISQIQEYIQTTGSDYDQHNVEDISKIREYIKTTGPKETSESNCDTRNEEDISQIQEYIQTTRPNYGSHIDRQVPLQVNLIQRGFDAETAKKIERELLDMPPCPDHNMVNIPLQQVQINKDETALEKNSSDKNELQIAHNETEEEDEDDEVEFSVHDCNEDSENYSVVHHEDTKEMSQRPPIKLKDNFSINICVSDGVTVRLRATPFNLTLDQDPLSVEEVDYSYNYKETELAVSSISNMERLYTPLKESFKAQCYEIFDSTLTSIDTPLKNNSPRKVDCETTVTEIEVEETHKVVSKKRQRSSGSDESTSDGKKTKYLLTSASIQNIDIESVLTKLHGP